jgi:predicted RNase H-like nuclease (RuvC/YqgF family)
MIEECAASGSGGGQGFDAPLRDIINDHLIPLLNGNNGLKTHLESMHSGMLLDKVVDIIQDLKDKCCKSLSLSDVTEFHSSLPILIETRLQELRDIITSTKKENKKIKKAEEKLLAENQKLKSDIANQRAEVKRGKTDSVKLTSEIKKLKDQVHKTKSDNEKLKQELANLREQMSKAGIDIQISSDFT